jgi:hypothetical protein
MHPLLTISLLAALAIAAPSPDTVTAAQPQGFASAYRMDFDGDGTDDLAIGSPGADVGGEADAGAVHVLYGDAGSGLSSQGSQIWHQDVAGILDSAEAGDRFGSSLAAGDFDLDGFGDLAIGIPGEDFPGHAGVGAVAVLFGGGPGGLHARDRFYAPTMTDGAEVGFALATVDFVGTGGVAGSDGRGDLAIGAPGWDDGTGRVLWVSGTELIPESMDGTAGGLMFPHDPGARNGAVLAAGDLSQTATDDLVIGAPFADLEVGSTTVTDAGRVTIWYDRATIHVLSQDTVGVPGEPEPGERFGSALAIGVGRSLMVGVPYEDHGGIVDAGSVMSWGSTPKDQFLHYPNPAYLRMGGDFFGGTAKAGDRLGSSIVIADLGLSPSVDYAAGLPGRDVGGVDKAGALAISYTAGLGSSVLLRQGVGGFTGDAEAGDRFGTALFAADFGGGPAGDLAMGVPLEDVGSAKDSGAVQVAYGDASGGLRSTDDESWTPNSAGIARTSTAKDRFGAAIR